MQKEPT